MQARYSEDVVRRAQEFYERDLKPRLEPQQNGKFLVINADTGEYVLGEDDVVVSREASTRFPGAPLFSMRVGYRAAHRLGGRNTMRGTAAKP